MRPEGHATLVAVEPSPQSERSPRDEPQTPISTPGRALIVLGLLAILTATLTLASAGYGTQPKRDFAQRRSYNMVKVDVRRAFPFVLVLGLTGLGLVLAGGRMRR